MKEINLNYFTVLPELKTALHALMAEPSLTDFRLVGGTSLSLQFGHRMSDDIDLFTELPYGDVDFAKIEKCLRRLFHFVQNNSIDVPGFGKMYSLGDSKEKSVKVDLMYTDEFIREPICADGIRLATTEEIAAMKIEILNSQQGRKKDFWDLHELLDHFSLDEMIGFHEERYPYNHDPKAIRRGFKDFRRAEEELNPICLRGKHWELIKMDLLAM